MTRTSRKQRGPRSFDGFAIPLQPETNLGLAMLIAEDEEGTVQPVRVVASINEAKEMAQSDFTSRRKRLERDEDPGLCPCIYRLWARGIDGEYRIAWTIPAGTL